MKQGRFKSIEEKRKFLRNRSQEQRLDKDAAGERRAQANEQDNSTQPRRINNIVQGGAPN